MKPSKFKIDKATMCAIGYGLLVALSWAIFGICGCAYPDSDPAARSARTEYGPITITASEGSTVTLTFGDGALAAADGNGEVSQPTTMTTTQSPTFTLTIPEGVDPLSAGIKGIVTLSSRGMEVYAAKKAADAAMAKAAKAECAESACSDKPCADGCSSAGGSCIGEACKE